jgi:cytoskeletal protein CcmA (bactofilin family)
VTGTHDIDVRGHLEGELATSGDVRVDTTATIAAPIRARRIVVRGAVKGTLTGDEAVALEEGARVVGDVQSPRVAIAPGGLLRGHVETGLSGPSQRKPTAATSMRHTPPAIPAASRVAAKASVKHAPPTKKTTMTIAGGPPPRKAGKAPPPVVPVLKKGTKGALTKKR